ncbi:NAD(P)/FAD-dependent oxidoreductase [Variovorax ginsengisoli]|uniref:FAD-dependent oxidoreductase n=1 Tax=Variovorax ginsengisoli TaxID=363844 RepID=A0ABT8SEV3_9BURK|nr:FAD-dependent oxidoreductase [Variovorax ginsengisoli]MDN8617357.1 FAD-dependent oxidoreductase [Variovorax ginsengisoli]MDO1536527.1 FAD-dependent oxidoreductase [Variovorax ginsengisoli]
MNEAGIVIVGAGQAGAQLALSLRQLKHAGRVTLLGDEFEPPYQRPPLSKAYMLGKIELSGMLLRNAAIYAQQEIYWRGGARVHAIHRADQRVELTSGDSIDYAALVLATGTRSRPLEVPGGRLQGVVYLRSFGEARNLRSQLDRTKKIIVVGGGFIGLEFAAVASSQGHNVTVLESASRLFPRTLSPPASEFFRSLHERAGVEVLCGQTLTRVEGDQGRATGVTLSDGRRLAADLVVVGIGVLPNSDLAREAGLVTDNGIRVNARLETEDPAVFAIGDCASFVSPFLASHVGTHVRLESVQNAVDHAKHLAARLTGAHNDYQSVPWFWSDQYDTKLQIAGLTQGADRWSIEGDPTKGDFGVHCFVEDRWLGFESINRPGEHMAARRILDSGHLLAFDEVRSASFDIRARATASA